MANGLGDDLSRLPFGAGSAAETAQQPAGLAMVAGGLYSALGDLAKRAFGASEQMRLGGTYDPAPIVDAAMLPMGTGVFGAPIRGAEMALGAGPVRRTLPDVEAWFGNSRVVDDAGKPLVVYRGEHGAVPEGGGFHSKLNSLSFGDAKAANTYAMSPNDWRDIVEAPRVTPGHLKIEKPIFELRDDPFIDIAHLEKQLGPEEARRIAHKFDSDIRYTGNWEENYQGQYDNVAHLLKERPEELKNLYFSAYKYLDDADEIALLKQRGYDGAIHIGNGETATDLEYRIFDPANWRSSIYGLGGALGSAVAPWPGEGSDGR